MSDSSVTAATTLDPEAHGIQSGIPAVKTKDRQQSVVTLIND
jgi:hypothetical protein